MKKVAILAAGALFVAACGGKVNQELIDAAPGYDALAMDMTSADTTPPANALGPGSTPGDGANPRVLDDPCHPHLFWRTHEVVARVNRHLYKFLGHVERVVHTKAKKSSASSATWFGSKNGVDAQLTITKTAPQQFSWKLELRKTGDTAWTTVFSGNIDRTGATAPQQGKGELTLDLDALHAVLPAEDVAGKLHATFDLTATKRLVAIDAGGVKWDPDADGDLARVAPLDASYTYLREPGVGGSFVLKDSMVFACPSNPTLAPAEVELVTRWIRTSAGEIHGRSDAKASGGQLPSGDAWMGVTCHERPADPTTAPSELFWMVKEEDAAGATIASWQIQSATGACDAAFGAVPSATSDATDFDFGAVTVPYPFPGMF